MATIHNSEVQKLAVLPKNFAARLSYFAENLSRMFQKNQTPALEGPDDKHNDPEA